MRLSSLLRSFALAAGLANIASSQTTGTVTADRVRFVLSTLAHDSMEGRGTGTRGSMRAAKFIAEQFRLAGLTPAGDSGFFQHVPMVTRMTDPASTITVDGTVLHAGVDFAVTAGRVNPRSIEGIQVIYAGTRADADQLAADAFRGKFVILAAEPLLTIRGAGGGGGRARDAVPPSCRDNPQPPSAGATRGRGGGGGGGGGGRGGRGLGGSSPLSAAAAVATIEGDQLSARTLWGTRHIGTAFLQTAASAPLEPSAATIQLTTHAAEVLLGSSLASVAKGATGKSIHSSINFVERPALGGNVVGIIEGSDPVMKNEVVLIDAHYDHLGIALPAAGSTDSIYNGADDDASGTTSVIEIARAIKAGPAPKRTLVFMATTGEEVGLVGTNWYIQHPVRPLTQMVANLEIEMMDRPDSLAGGSGKAWLTGFERSTMGDTLSAHGVPIVKDPRPDQLFFQRSDNIAFARMGIPAHTLSSFDLHRDYHQANDETSLANFNHMAGVINAAVVAVKLLGNGFTPEWYPGCKP